MRKDSEDLWLGCALGYRFTVYLAGNTNCDLKHLTFVLKQIAEGERAYADRSWSERSDSIWLQGCLAKRRTREYAIRQGVGHTRSPATAEPKGRRA